MFRQVSDFVEERSALVGCPERRRGRKRLISPCRRLVIYSLAVHCCVANRLTPSPWSRRTASDGAELPQTAIIAQAKLGLETCVAAFDIRWVVPVMCIGACWHGFMRQVGQSNDIFDKDGVMNYERRKS